MIYYCTSKLLNFGFGVFKTLLIVLVNQSLDILNYSRISFVINYRIACARLNFFQFIYTGFNSLHASVDAFHTRLLVVGVIVFTHGCLNLNLLNFGLIRILFLDSFFSYPSFSSAKKVLVHPHAECPMV